MTFEAMGLCQSAALWSASAALDCRETDSGPSGEVLVRFRKASGRPSPSFALAVAITLGLFALVH